MKTLFYRLTGPSLKVIDDSKTKKQIIEFTNLNEGQVSVVRGIVLDYLESKKASYVTINFHVVEGDPAWIKPDRAYPVDYNFETMKGEMDLTQKNQIELACLVQR